MSTFLLEMALDEARLRQRLAQLLLAERAKRGGGDARRFPQPRMATLLGVTLRAYQDWEGGVRVPTWRNLEEISEKLSIPVAELVGQDEPEEPPVEEATPSPPTNAEVLQRLDQIEASVESLRQVVVEALAASSGHRAVR